MAVLTTQEIDTAGTAPTFTAAATGGDEAETGTRVFLVVKNANAGSTRDVTIAGQGVLETGDAYPDKVYTVPISGEVWVPLLGVYRDSTTGRAAITYSTEVDLTVAAVKI